MLKLRYLLIGIIIGLVLGWVWLQGETQNRPSSSYVPPKPKPVPRPVPRNSKDPLTEIDGIGPAYERALNALGIFTYEALAAQDAEALASKMSARVTSERIRREQWIEQAKSRLK